MIKKIQNKGISLVEVVMGTAIILAITVGFVSISITFIKSTSNSIYNTKAVFLSEEGIEAMKTLRDLSWNSNIANLSVNTNYYIYFDNVNNLWKITTNPQPFIEGLFERKISIQNVPRDGSGRIGLGTNDLNTRLVSVSLSWFDRNLRATTTDTMKSYLMNLFDN